MPWQPEMIGQGTAVAEAPPGAAAAHLTSVATGPQPQKLWNLLLPLVVWVDVSCLKLGTLCIRRALSLTFHARAALEAPRLAPRPPGQC